MDEKFFVEKIAEIAEVEVSEIKMSTELNELDAWDSLATLSFIVFVSDKLGKRISGQEIKKANTINDLWKLVNFDN